jgi:monothiol glutaredoxin
MTLRPSLDSSRIAPLALEKMGAFHQATIREIESAIASNDVVVVGMAGNPHVRKARKGLDDAGIAHTYLEYGGYLSEWRRRLAIKLWSGWPTFPQVFVKGVLLGGEVLTRAALADGSLRERLAEKI